MLGPLTTPLYILPDHLASTPTTLRAKHNTRGGFAFSKFPSETEETIPPEPLFTVSSRSTLRAPRRLIHNASTDQLLLELWRNHVGNESYIGVPNSAALPLATLAPRPTKVRDRVDVYVKNAALGGEEVKLEVRGQDVWKRNTCVYWGNEVVAQVRFVNYVTSYVPFSSNQWDVVVAEGFDLSLVSSLFSFGLVMLLMMGVGLICF